MDKFKQEQRRLEVRGRTFHFVSYEGQVVRGREGPPDPPMWHLMVEGRRCPAIPALPNQPEDELDRALTAWVRENALGKPAETRTAEVAVRTGQRIRWWGLE